MANVPMAWIHIHVHAGRDGEDNSVSQVLEREIHLLRLISKTKTSVWLHHATAIQDSRFKNGLLQFQEKFTWHTFQD